METHVHMFESSQLEGSYVGDLLYMLSHKTSFNKFKKIEIIKPLF